MKSNVAVAWVLASLSSGCTPVYTHLGDAPVVLLVQSNAATSVGDGAFVAIHNGSAAATTALDVAVRDAGNGCHELGDVAATLNGTPFTVRERGQYESGYGCAYGLPSNTSSCALPAFSLEPDELPASTPEGDVLVVADESATLRGVIAELAIAPRWQQRSATSGVRVGDEVVLEFSRSVIPEGLRVSFDNTSPTGELQGPCPGAFDVDPAALTIEGKTVRFAVPPPNDVDTSFCASCVADCASLPWDGALRVTFEPLVPVSPLEQPRLSCGDAECAIFPVAGVFYGPPMRIER